jgi:hypothetical protein
VRPNITLHSLSGKTKHYITLPLWKDKTLHYTPSLDRPNITLYSLSGKTSITLCSLSGKTKHYIILVSSEREYNVMFGLSREGV